MTTARAAAVLQMGVRVMLSAKRKIQMKIRLLKLGALAAGVLTSTISVGAAQGAAQNAAKAAAPAPTPVVIQTEPELLSFPDLIEQAKPLLDQARAGDGSAAITLAHYKGHYTMLSARTASGGAELHKHFADFLFVLAGQGTELTGGTIVDPKEGENGEVKGTRLDGAVPRVLRRGDVIHIPAGTPHQAIEGPGQSITVFVVKVEER
jgi:mannose-6-phosphate isomerase-like protein (cupin superfamily)